MAEEREKLRSGGSDLRTLRSQGAYGALTWLLTGANATWKSMQPRCPFPHFGDGWGAWEVVCRADYVDIEDVDGTPGNRTTEITVAVKWYLNGNSQVMLNYVNERFAHRLGGSRSIDTIPIRFQIAF